MGIEGTGQLTGALLENPDAVVLLDEFEKAHPEVIISLCLSLSLSPSLSPPPSISLFLSLSVSL